MFFLGRLPRRWGVNMTDYEKIWSFENLYKAHKKARLGKRNTKEVIEFELNLGKSLSDLSDSIKKKTYAIGGYYAFTIYDPKVRRIHALHYRDRVVQHCLCDEVLAPLLEKRMIYDTAACRKEKGTHFALKRLNHFLSAYYKQYGATGYILKCDFRKFFDNIDHDILKNKLQGLPIDEDTSVMLCHIIDSYETNPGKGLPMGNQTSQWFANYYLDKFDRLIKEKLRVPYYSRYMDDCVILERNKDRAKEILAVITKYVQEELLLEFNSKTQITSIKNGVRYLGWHFYLSNSGKVIRKIVNQTKCKYKRRLKNMQVMYATDKMEFDEIKQVLASYRAHLRYGHSYRLQKRICDHFVLKKQTEKKAVEDKL